VQSVEEILDFAIAREQQAVDFYKKLSAMAPSRQMQELMQNYAKEEQRHKDKLLAVKVDGALENTHKRPVDLKIADYIVSVEETPEMSYQDALIIAMKREQKAFRLYTDMAEKIDDPQLKSLFESLAREEASHKNYFESEYDDKIYTDN
jgi:rubrerythrin